MHPPPCPSQVSCSHDGCTWKGPYSELNPHESSCPSGQPTTCGECGDAVPCGAGRAHSKVCLQLRLEKLRAAQRIWDEERRMLRREAEEVR